MTVRDQVTADADFIALKLAGVRFVDNGDGTVTDVDTGLMWEQKTTAVGSGVNLADPHDVDNTYTWSTGTNKPDGMAYTDFLGALNGGTSPDGVATSGCFAGHCDWRLPTVEELQTILLAAYPCGTSPCIDSAFGPTQSNYYWSATTSAGAPDRAWDVYFYDGIVNDDYKTSCNYVRAVRGGL